MHTSSGFVLYFDVKVLLFLLFYLSLSKKTSSLYSNVHAKFTLGGTGQKFIYTKRTTPHLTLMESEFIAVL